MNFSADMFGNQIRRDYVSGTTNTSYGLKRPKVYATRDFPDGCGVPPSQIGEKGAANFANVGSSEHSNAKSTANSLGSCSKNSDTRVNHEVVSPSTTREEEREKAEQSRVKEVLKLFHELYKKLSDEHKREHGAKSIGAQRLDIKAATALKKKGKYLHYSKQFGHIPGISIGDYFHYRAELTVVSLHDQFTSGIDFTSPNLNGKNLATSVVNSGRYENRAKTVDVLIYSGQGGHSGFGKKTKITNQKLEGGNLALKNSIESGYPVRVIHKTNDKEGGVVYIYDGLYSVEKFSRENDGDGMVVFKFEMHRLSNQQKLSHQQVPGNSRKSKLASSRELCVVGDVSQGRENTQISVKNGVDGEKPGNFTYITNVIYPEWFLQIRESGCDCSDGVCSGSGGCGCVLGQKGNIVYECGPSCKCPPSCVNRVCLRGPPYKLELFRTESRGWGVRSKSFISSGSFVCEFVGKLIQMEEGFFIIDATKFGNVGRFIGCSSEPNLFVQRVVYDHDDLRMPHVMFFAAKNIRPLQELTCDYDHQGQIRKFQYRL